MPPTKRPIIVALSGPTSSGKTTIANSLHQLFRNSILIHLDDFYVPDKEIPFDEVRQESNWDCPEALNYEKFSKYVENVKKNGIDANSGNEAKSYEGDVSLQLTKEERHHFELKLSKYQDTPIAFVEGFMLYHDPKIVSLFDVKLFFYASYDCLKARRESRSGYNTVAGFWVDPPGYFEKMVWPEYVKNHAHLFNNNDVNDTLNEYSLKELQIIPYKNDANLSLVELLEWSLEQIPLN